ncbi:MAG: hypothetical protein DDT31_00629 [Syntrophomonadaceae bacterium]|nr:hypothetical protein [Bacillota bacterium]
MIATTLAALHAHKACKPSWARLLSGLGKTEADNEPLLIATILNVLDVVDATWALRAVTGYDREIHDLAIRYARTYQMRDPRHLAALDVTKFHNAADAAWDLVNYSAEHERIMCDWLVEFEPVPGK